MLRRILSRRQRTRSGDSQRRFERFWARRVLDFHAGRDIELERFNVRELVFASEWADYIVKERPELAARVLHGRRDRRLAGGGRVPRRPAGARDRARQARAVLEGAVDVTFELIDVRDEPEVPARLLPALVRLGRESGVTRSPLVDEGKRGLLYIEAGWCANWGPARTASGTRSPRLASRCSRCVSRRWRSRARRS